MNMIASLDHVNYIIVGNQEYETVEGRLNVDEGKLELLLVPCVTNSSTCHMNKGRRIRRGEQACDERKV